MKGITESKAPAPSKSPKPEKHGAGPKTDKQRLQERLAKAGVIGVEKMTKVQLQKELARIKSEGGTVPDLRANNSAPTSLAVSDKVTAMKESHLMELVEVTTVNRETGKTTTTKRETMLAILDMLRHEALKSKSVAAAKEYLDRTLGKSKQEIEHSGEIKVDDQRVPTEAEREAAAMFRRALRATRE